MRKVVILVLLLGLVNTAADGETYRCRSREGTLVLTDDPANLPPGCTPEERKGGKGALSVVPYPSILPPQAGKAKELQTQQKGSDRAKGWKKEARKLADEYKQALIQRYRVMPAAEKRLILNRIGEIKKQRDNLLQQIAEGTLSRRQRAEIEEVLGEIPP